MTERDMGQGSAGTTSSSYPSFNEQASPSGDQPNQNKQASPSTPSTADIRQKVSEDMRTVQQTAQDGISQATEKAKDLAGSQKNFLAEKMSGIAAAMEKVGGELEQGEQKDIGGIAKTIGSSMRKFSDDIKDRDISEIAGMAEDFGRKQPFAFLGVAAIAGLAASRFLTASSQRSHAKPSSAPTTAASTSSAMPTSGTGATSAPVHPAIHPTTEGPVNG